MADAWVQLTLTAFFVGLAAGQLFIGPLSDVLGRKTLLLLGAVGGRWPRRCWRRWRPTLACWSRPASCRA